MGGKDFFPIPDSLDLEKEMEMVGNTRRKGKEERSLGFCSFQGKEGRGWFCLWFSDELKLMVETSSWWLEMQAIICVSFREGYVHVIACPFESQWVA